MDRKEPFIGTFLQQVRAWKRPLSLLLLILLFSLLILFFFRDTVTQDRIFIERDLSRYYYPLRKFAVDTIRSGSFPLWNPFLGCGYPFFATLQTCILYPGSIIYYLGDFTKAFNHFILFHFLLGSIFVYILMKDRGSSAPGAAVAAAAFTFSGYMVSVVNLVPILSSVVWFVPCLIFLLRMLERKRYVYSLLLGITLTLMFLAGDPSHVYITSLMIFTAGAYFTVRTYIRERRICPFYAKAVLAAHSVFLVLSAVQLFPFVEFVLSSNRTRMGAGETAVWSFPLRDLASLFIPFFHDTFVLFEDYFQRQSWLDNYYIGLPTMVLALLGITRWKDRRTRLAVFLAAAGMLLCMGGLAGRLLFRILPGYRFIRYPVRFFYIPTLGACVLAGAGLDHYLGSIRKGGTGGIMRSLLFSALGMAILLALMYHLHPRISLFLKGHFSGLVKKSPGDWADYFIYMDLMIVNFRRSAMVFIIFVLALFIGTYRRIPGAILPLILGALLTLDLFMVNRDHNISMDTAVFKEPTSNVRYLMAAARDTGLFRITSDPATQMLNNFAPEKEPEDQIQNSKDRLVDNRMIEFGLYHTGVYDSLIHRRTYSIMKALRRTSSPSQNRLLDLLNVRFFASSNRRRSEIFPTVNMTSAASLYENRSYLPRAFLVGGPIEVKDGEEALAMIAGNGFDPERGIIIEGLPENAGVTNTWSSEKGSVVIKRYLNNIVELYVDVPAGEKRFLFLSDTFYPGWMAWVDGRKERILRANYNFRAVMIGPGEHTVLFRFVPGTFYAGLMISLLGIIGLAFLLLKRPGFLIS